MQQPVHRGWLGYIRASLTLFAILSACVRFPEAGFAQTTTTGSINGTVADSTRAVLPNSAVIVTNTATGATLHLTSNAEGRFTTTTFTTSQFQNLPAPGGDITTIAYTVPGVVVGADTARRAGAPASPSVCLTWMPRMRWEPMRPEEPLCLPRC